MATLPVVKRVKLGSQGMETSQQGLGCMGMSFFFGPPKPDKDMIDLIHYAVDCGVTYLDTSQAYGPFTNEILVGKGVKGIREKVEIGTKFGMLVNEKKQMDFRADPASVRACCEASLKRLDTDYIDLYTLHRVDPKVPIEITVGALKELVAEGKVRYIGLSEASSSEIRRAHAVHPITAVQLEWSLWSRDVEEDIIGTCRELGIGIVAYSPLGQGFFGGLKAEELADNDMRKTRMPRVSPANYENNKKYFDRLVEIGKKHGKTPGQVALAWVQHKGEDVVSIPGTTKTKNLEENISSLSITFTKEEIEEIETAVPAEDITGDRYPSMHHTWRYSSTPPLSSWQGTKA